MKKAVFATQVFGLLAMLPILVILEMNHAHGHGNMPPGCDSKTENTITGVPGKASGELPGEAVSVSLETLFFIAVL